LCRMLHHSCDSTHQDRGQAKVRSEMAIPLSCNQEACIMTYRLPSIPSYSMAGSHHVHLSFGIPPGHLEQAPQAVQRQPVFVDDDCYVPHNMNEPLYEAQIQELAVVLEQRAPSPARGITVSTPPLRACAKPQRTFYLPCNC
jgi:hypothetical protein